MRRQDTIATGGSITGNAARLKPCPPSTPPCATGPFELSDTVAVLDTTYLNHVNVLWAWALKKDADDTAESTTVRFRSLDGRDREIAVPPSAFGEPLAGVTTWQQKADVA